MKSPIYNSKGKEAGSIDLPESVFGAKWNADLVHQVVTGMMSNKRAGTANAKGRGEVRGGGKKPWQQKGTGRARHASIRSPLWAGGGVTHGPLAERNYKKKINKKMKTAALYSALSQKFRDGEILFIDSLALSGAKTKNAAMLVASLSSIKGFEKLKAAKKPVAYVAIPERSADFKKSFRNLKSVVVDPVKELNAVDTMTYRYLIIVDPEKAIGILEGKRSKK